MCLVAKAATRDLKQIGAAICDSTQEENNYF